MYGMGNLLHEYQISTWITKSYGKDDGKHNRLGATDLDVYTMTCIACYYVQLRCLIHNYRALDAK